VLRQNGFVKEFLGSGKYTGALSPHQTNIVRNDGYGGLVAGAQPRDAIRKSPGTIWSLFLARFFFQLIEISGHLFGLISEGARRRVGALITWWLKTTMSARKAPCARNPRTLAHKRVAGIALKINSFGNSWDQGLFGIAFALFYSGSS
jgi:hypothetical protein